MASHTFAQRDTFGRRLLLIVLIGAILIGLAAAIQPTYAAVGVGALLAGIPALLLLRNIGQSLIAERQGVITQVALIVVLVSLVRVHGRDALEGGLGLQAIYEFAFQGIAFAILLLAMAFYGLRLRFTPSVIFWIAAGTMAMITSFWAPQPLLAVTKSAQLIALVLIVAIAAMQFNDRYRAVRFIVWVTLLIVLAAFVVQGLTGGFASLWEGADRLWSPRLEERYRLSVLSFHPIMLGNLTAAAAILMLAHHPRRIDWLAFGLLGTLCFLTNARAAFILFLLCVIAYVVVRSGELRERRAIRAIGALAGSILAILAFVYLANTGGLSLPSAIADLDARDVQTLNGRTPLWQTIFEEGAARTEAGLGLLTGYGYTSFRHFGLDHFAYAGEAHNAYIQVLFEIGVIGLIFWLLAIGIGAWQAVRGSQGFRARFYLLLPAAYILATQMVDSALADSRSFLLVFLVFQAHIALGGSSPPEPATSEPESTATPPASDESAFVPAGSSSEELTANREG